LQNIYKVEFITIIIEIKMMTQRKNLTWWKENDGAVNYTDEDGKVHNAPAVVWKANDGSMWHLCRFTRIRSSGRVYHWKPRKENPVSCPRCRYRFDSPYGEEE